MTKRNKNHLAIAACALALFVMWTVAVRYIDVQAIGPRGSRVGFATINRLVHNITGVNMPLYNITDWLGLVPVAFMFGFAGLGLCQWIARKRIWLVDFNILALGGFYIAITLIYLFFEWVVINYRPVLINGYLEASYPSSTTLLVMSVMPTAIMQLNRRIKNMALRKIIAITLAAFTAFMVAGRLVSGVHWITDIIGSALLCTGLVLLYSYVIGKE